MSDSSPAQDGPPTPTWTAEDYELARARLAHARAHLDPPDALMQALLAAAERFHASRSGEVSGR